MDLCGRLYLAGDAVHLDGSIFQARNRRRFAVRAIGEAAVWTVVLVAVCLVLWKRGIRVYQAEEDIM